MDQPRYPPWQLWPFAAAATASGAVGSYFTELAHVLGSSELGRDSRKIPEWTTPNRVRLALQTMRLRDFSVEDQGTPTLILAPFALHESTITDFAPGHSIVQVLRNAGLPRVFVTDWRSACP